MKKEKLLSLVCCVLMMCAAALCVNKTLFGYPHAEAEGGAESAGDTVSVLADGSRVIHTRTLTDAVGYSGPVPLDVHISGDGTITEITALDNAESPNFFGRAEKLLQSYIGHSAEEVEDMHVDAISGATYSSEALKANVRAAAAYYLADSATAHGDSMPPRLWLALAVTLCACVIPLFVNNRIYTTAQLIANVAVLGFWSGQFLDYALMLKCLSGGISLPAGLTIVCMLIAAFIYPLFGKPQHYCNHICPLGSAQLLVAQICKYKVKISGRTLRALDWFRKILWAALMLLLWADVATTWMDLELFQAFLPESAPVGIIVAAALFVALSAVVSKPYCRFVCPTGSLFKRSENIG